MATKTRHTFLSFLFVVGLLVGAFFLVSWVTDWVYDQSPAVIFVVGAAVAVLVFELVRTLVESRFRNDDD